MENSSRSKKISRWRFVRAYVVTFQILSRYLTLFLLRKFFGKGRFEGILFEAHQKTAKKIVANIIQLKGVYIKIGQTLSVMTNFLPPAFTSGLESLQDAVPPHPYDEIVKRFETDLGKQPEELFASFDKTPIASASLAQVHVARAKDGAKLAVKLQYPDIDRLVLSDLATIRRIFGLIDFLFPNYGLRQVYQESAKMILNELDFETEGRNLEQIRKNFTEHPQYLFPKVYLNISSKKILTAEFIDGIKVSNVAALREAGIDPHEVAVSLIHMYCKQIFVDGVYHADPHPGNIIVVPNHGSTSSPCPKPDTLSGVEGSPAQFKIALVDYGATATISPDMKQGITLFVEGVMKKDTRTLSAAMKQMGFIAREDREEAFDKVVDYFYGKIRGIKIENFRQINIGQFQHLNDLFELKKMDISFRELSTLFHVPKEWVLFERALLLMMGLVTHLDPSLNPVDIVVPYVEEFVLGKDKTVADLIVQTTKELLLSYINLPTQIQRVLKKLEEGKISISGKEGRENAEKISRSIRQLSVALLFGVSALFGLYFYDLGDRIWVARMQAASGFFGLWLAWGFLRNRK